jgi:hypothetical protein
VQDLQCSSTSTPQVSSDFTGAYRSKIYSRFLRGFTGKYRCRIYNAVSRSTPQVAQGLTGIIRGSESILQIAESFTSIYRTELTESKQGKKISSMRIKLNSRRRTRTREHAAAGTRTRTRS